MDKKPFRSGKKEGNRRKGFKNVGFVAILALIAAVVYAGYNQPSQLKTVPLSEVVQQANDGKYSKITVKGTSLEITEKGKDKPTLVSQKDANDSLVKDDGVDQSKVTIEYNKPSDSGNLWANFRDFHPSCHPDQRRVVHNAAERPRPGQPGDELWQKPGPTVRQRKGQSNL